MKWLLLAQEPVSVKAAALRALTGPQPRDKVSPRLVHMEHQSPAAADAAFIRQQLLQPPACCGAFGCPPASMAAAAAARGGPRGVP